MKGLQKHLFKSYPIQNTFVQKNINKQTDNNNSISLTQSLALSLVLENKDVSTTKLFEQ